MKRFLFLLFLLLPAPVLAHPTVPNQAIQATTIAEMFISPKEIRLELEIGDKDRKVFEPLFGKQYTRFLERELVLEADGETLAGEVLRFEGRRRVIRNPITGEPIVGAKPVEPITFVEIRYPLEQRPQDLIIKPPFALDGPAANIGIVVHHGSMPVNDFDYLNYRETIRLDWNDPWFSKVRSPRLKRYYNSPLAVFVYTDPREVRIEIILRLRTLLDWFPLEVTANGTLTAHQQQSIRQRIGDFLIQRTDLTVDGVAVKPTVDQLQFLRLNLAKIEAITDLESTHVDTTMLGAVLVVPSEQQSRNVNLKWNLFSSRIQTVPASPNQSLVPKLLTPNDPELNWQFTGSESPRLDVRTLKPLVPQLQLPLPSLLIGLLAVYAIGMRTSFSSGRGRWAVVFGLLLVAGLLWQFGRVSVTDPFAKSRRLSDTEAKQVMQVLLENVYHAFDFRSEEMVYDTLATSVAGDLLRQTYLDIRKSLEVQNQTARAKEVILQEVQITPLEGDTGLKARCQWTVRAAVTHWGHTHERTQLYIGELTIQWRDETWKITGLNLLEQKDLEPKQGQ
jgi:hypothetical protein